MVNVNSENEKKVDKLKAENASLREKYLRDKNTHKIEIKEIKLKQKSSSFIKNMTQVGIQTLTVR